MVSSSTSDDPDRTPGEGPDEARPPERAREETSTEPARDERVLEEERAAAGEAASIGGDPGTGEEDPAARPVVEGGGGEAEGFEEAEDRLREHAEHGADSRTPTGDAFPEERETDRSSAVQGDADRLDPSEPDIARRRDASPPREDRSRADGE